MSQPILLVDDDPTIVELVARVLKRAGYDVVSANNGAQALTIAQADPGISLVLSDIVMPEMNGIELCQRLKASRPELKIILMSGYSMGMVVRDSDAHFLPKPFVPQALLEKVQEVLELSLVA